MRKLNKLNIFLTSTIVVLLLWSTIFLLPILAQMNTTTTNGEVVNILNLYNGQVLTENYILDFEAIEGAEHLQLIFVDTDGIKDSREAYAYQSGSDPNIWHYNLEVAELGDGSYRLETSVIFSDSTIMAGDIREFSINQNTGLSLEVSVINPKEGDTIFGNYLFEAETNQIVDNLYFNIYTGTGILMLQEQGNETDTDYHYQADYNTNSLDDGEYIVRANATLGDSTVNSEDVSFYINNQSNSATTSIDTTTSNNSGADNSNNNTTTTSTTATTTTATADDDDLAVEIQIEFTSPNNNDTVQETVLFQAKTNRVVDNVYFRIDGDYISAKKFDNNIWQEYVDTTVYTNGLVEVITVATDKGVDYYDALELNIKNEIITDNTRTTDQNNENNENKSNTNESDCIQQIYYARSSVVAVCQKFTDSCSVPPGWESCEPNNEIISQTEDQDSQENQTSSTREDDDSSNSNDSKEGVFIDDSGIDSDQKESDCQDLDIQNIDCQDYLTNIKNYPQECVIDKIDLADCESKYQECQTLEIEDIDLCFKYLSEPRQSRWCDLSEFKDLKVCQSYFEKNYQNKQSVFENDTKNNFSQECLDQNITDEKKCEKFLYYLRLPIQCRENKIYNKQECENLLENDYLQKVCQQIGVSDLIECQNKLIQTYQNKFVCNNADCTKIVKEKFINELAVKDIINKNIKEILKLYDNKFFYSNQVTVTKQQEEMIAKMSIIYKSGSQYKIIPAEDKIKITANDLEAPLPAVLVKDSDSDGVPDDIEDRLGTDKYNFDSDKDGYSDGVELKNGYDPLVPKQKLMTQLAPIELALIDGKILEHPLVSGNVSNDLKIKTFKNISSDEEPEVSRIALSGTGPAFSILSLFIYSDLPMVATIQVDEFGRWEYTMTDSLIDGEHQVFIALNDNNGKIVKKSTGSVLFVKEAKAATADEIINFNFKTDSNSMVSYYYYGVAIIIILGLLLFFILRKSLKKDDLVEL